MSPREQYYSLQLFNIDFVDHEIDVRYNAGLWYGEAIDHLSAYCAGGEL